METSQESIETGETAASVGLRTLINSYRRWLTIDDKVEYVILLYKHGRVKINKHVDVLDLHPNPKPPELWIIIN